MINPNVDRFLDVDASAVDFHTANALLMSLAGNLCLAAGFSRDDNELWTGPEPIVSATSINGYTLDFKPNELWGCLYMSETTGKCDPVLPLDPDEWQNLVRSARIPHSERYDNSLGSGFRKILTPDNGDLDNHQVPVPIPRDTDMDIVREGFGSAQRLTVAVLGYYNIL